MVYHIKLSSVNSTNDFLKNIIKTNMLPSGAVVSANFQEKGRGQLKNSWDSERGKNLLCSFFYRFKKAKISDITYLNYAVSIAVYETLQTFQIPDLKIKWANDIMAKGKKIAGILIENTTEKTHLKQSIIGIGINVNQKTFPTALKNATSIFNILEQEIPVEKILTTLSKKLKKYINTYEKANFETLQKTYHQALFLKGIPYCFEAKNKTFQGTIQGVNAKGELMILHKNGVVKNYIHKSIRFLQSPK